MDLDIFEEFIHSFIKEELPEEFLSKLDNVDFFVELWPTEEEMRRIEAHPGTLLFGLYQGIPRTKRGLYYSAALPDRITIYIGPILATSTSINQAKEQIKSTVLHEIGHYFGLSEMQIRKAEKERVVNRSRLR